MLKQGKLFTTIIDPYFSPVKNESESSFREKNARVRLKICGYLYVFRPKQEMKQTKKTLSVVYILIAK